MMFRRRVLVPAKNGVPADLPAPPAEGMLGRMKTGAQLARERSAARMAELNKAKGL